MDLLEVYEHGSRVIGLLAVWHGSSTILEFLGRVKHINGWLVLKTNECSGWVLDIGKSSCSERSRYILKGLLYCVYIPFNRR
jgi:hypothetical protein